MWGYFGFHITKSAVLNSRALKIESDVKCNFMPCRICIFYVKIAIKLYDSSKIRPKQTKMCNFYENFYTKMGVIGCGMNEKEGHSVSDLR